MSRQLASNALALSVFAVFGVLTYGRLLVIANRLARAAVQRVQPRTVPFRDAVGIAVLPAWFVVIGVVYVPVAVIYGLPIARLYTDHFHVRDIVYGVFLGIAEAAVIMTLSVNLAALLAPLRKLQRGGNPILEHRLLAQSGWMRTYQYPLMWLPRPLAICVVALPMCGEELVFRATGIPLLSPLGVWPAVALSTLLFMAVQTAHLPSWYQAVGPMSGALVLGVVQGTLFARDGNLLPLQIAHVTFFLMIATGVRPAYRPSTGDTPTSRVAHAPSFG